MDCSVIPLEKYKSYCLVQSVDFFYPLVDDPYVMGKIALANVVSDIYAVGVTEIDKLSMIISSPTELTDNERNVIVPMIIDGFREGAKEAGCRVGIQSIALNPWCMIGGVATSLNLKTDIVMPSNAQPGDILVLTKPLGMHLATNAFIWMQEKNEKYLKLLENFEDRDIIETFQIAIKCMTFLNKTAATLMHKYNAHAATDVTGFGLIGHTQNLAEFQKLPLLFKIKALPIVKNVVLFSKAVNQCGKLLAGKAVETSGGLLIALPAHNADAFCKEFANITNGEHQAWIVGEVVADEKRHATLIENPLIIEANIQPANN